MKTDLKKSKAKYHKQAVLTKSKIAKLNLLNKLLSKMEIVLVKKCRQVENKIIKENKTSVFPATDYEIGVEISYYSKKIIKRFKEEEEGCLYTQKWSSIYQAHRLDEPFKQHLYPYLFKGKEIVFESCSTFRLLMNSDLTIGEVLFIDNIWWDIEVRYQYKRSVK